MKDKELKKLVDRSVALHREIAVKSELLKRLKTQLVQQARLSPDSLVATDSGGKRWTAEGTDGCIARVNFPAPGIVAGIESGTETLGKLETFAGDKFRRLFTPVRVFQPVEQFRQKVAALLPGSEASAIVAICENESAPRVSFEVAKPVCDQTDAKC